jgi:hypothetical protein
MVHSDAKDFPQFLKKVKRNPLRAARLILRIKCKIAFFIVAPLDGFMFKKKEG